jgi:hypothetical protein
VLEQRRGGRDGGHPIADGVCQSAEQIVMYRKPAGRADLGRRPLGSV